MSQAVKYQPRVTCELRRESWESCSAHIEKVVRIKDHETHLGEFDVLRCRRCQLGYTDPYPTEDTSGRLYDAKESSDFDVVQDTAIDRVKDTLSRRLLASLAPHDHVRAVLDYSTGNGRFAVSAAAVFPDARVDAVDYQEAPPPLLSRPSNGVQYYSLAAFQDHEQRYDLIILRHVLEHTHHPVDLVRFLGSRLAVDGVLYIEVPNLDSGGAQVFGTKWKGFYVPRHIFHYTVASLTEIVERAGLTAEIHRNEMPLMGNTVAILTGADQSNVLVQGLGVLLHPVQLLIEKWHGSSTCINARCRLPR
jgi:2-polyprenyl-3-methyl-5-hydroxy-6-metoxy-1,4-benzoquinol methylase